MRTSLHLLAGATALGLVTGVAGTAAAQTAANREGAQLLSPFTTLLNSDAGKSALAQNLAASIAVNTGANQARQDLARSDNNSYTDGRQFTVSFGTTLDAAYQKAIAAKNPALVSGGAVYTALSAFTGVSGADSAFLKYYLANGTTNGTTPATGITLPSGYQFNVYDKAYGVTTTQTGQNPYGNSRPFQVAPGQINPFAADITATLTTNSAIPSGHTTFGTTEALLMAMAVPERFSASVARGADYGYSRVVLGAHYALDVIAGRILATRDVAQMLNNNPNFTPAVAAAGGSTDYRAIFNNFATSLRSVLTSNAGTDIATGIAQDSGAYANTAQVKADAIYRLTYGIQAVGPTNLPPVVPDGAEVLLSTRFPYLSAAQRRDVLGSTEIPSGFPLDDGTGWARLDLYTAGGGYGSFSGIVMVTQDASQGGLSAADTWSNAIGGAGGLVHGGTGQLTLTGANGYAGGTLLTGGTLVAGSASALGTGSVEVDGGTLRIGVDGFTVGGNYTETGGMLVLSTFDLDQLMSIVGNASLGGMLVLDLGQYGTRAGDYALMSWGSHNGQFGSVQLANLGGGFSGTLRYAANGLFLTVAAIPEPATWASMVAGFAMLGGALRGSRRRRSAFAA